MPDRTEGKTGLQRRVRACPSVIAPPTPSPPPFFFFFLLLLFLLLLFSLFFPAPVRVGYDVRVFGKAGPGRNGPDCGAKPMDYSEIQELIRLFEATGLSEMEVEENGRRVRLAKQLPVETVSVPARPVPAPPPGRPAPGDAAPDPETEALLAEGLTTIDSPMVGTFYASSSPADPPFVQVGDTVDAEQVVCIVEAMKIMNEVTAKVPAIVERVLVKNGAPVEYGQPLLAVRPLA